jgi:predicted dehydrogenase/threonine dehydrogenase-like Zn-dependent dehydrogenase
MKQLLRKGLKHIIVEEVPDPIVTAHHVLIRPFYSLISSGTETASIHREGVLKTVVENPSHLDKIWSALKTQNPLRTFSEIKAKFSEYAVLGYSGAGVVVDKHRSVADLELGDRVAYGGEGTGHGETILAGRNLIVKIPDAVHFEYACFATLGSIALNGVRIAKISLGEKVAVIGLGLVGQLVAQLLRLQGGFVVCTDLRADRVELARRLGADAALHGGAQFVEQIAALTDGLGVDCVVIAAAAKSAAPCQLAVNLCRDRGRIVDVGAVELQFPWFDMYRKEIRLLMARAYGPGSYDPLYEQKAQDYPLPYVRWTENRNMEEFLRLVAAGRIQLEPLVTHKFRLEDAPKAYETIMDPASNSLAVLLRYPVADSTHSVTDFQPRHAIEVKGRPSTSSWGVALAGAGNLARWVHLPNLKKIPGVRLRAIYSSSGARGKNYAQRFGAEYCASDYDEILKDPEIQTVVIVSRNPQHAPQALAALRAGKHVFVEKPMAITEAECRMLSQAVEETGKQLSIGFNRRFAPSYLALKQQLSLRVGPAVVNCRINSPGISGSYWMAEAANGGAIVGEACHFVDLMYWLLNSEPVAVSAFSLPTGKKDPIGENNLVASFRFSDGSVANLTYCTLGSRTSGGERVEAFAPGLGAMAEDFRRITLRTSSVHKTSTWFPQKGYAAQMQGFFTALRESRPPEVTVRDGARATIGCLRMLDSARSLAPCTIDLNAALALQSSLE